MDHKVQWIWIVVTLVGAGFAFGSWMSQNAAQRVYLLVDKIESDHLEPGKPFAAHVTRKNTGLTPALNVKPAGALILDDRSPASMSKGRPGVQTERG